MTKQEEGFRIWACDRFRYCAKTPKDIAKSAITNLAFNANKSFGFLYDPTIHADVVVGRNKPDDLPLLGIIWEDLGEYCGK